MSFSTAFNSTTSRSGIQVHHKIIAKWNALVEQRHTRKRLARTPTDLEFLFHTSLVDGLKQSRSHNPVYLDRCTDDNLGQRVFLVHCFSPVFSVSVSLWLVPLHLFYHFG